MFRYLVKLKSLNASVCESILLNHDQQVKVSLLKETRDSRFVVIKAASNRIRIDYFG